MRTNDDRMYKWRFILAILPVFLISCGIWILIQYIYVSDADRVRFVDEIYKKEFKNIFFTGFLTLGSFLFAMKSFTLVNLKKEIYDKESYQKDFINDINTKGIDPKSYLSPFKNLSNLLFLAVFSSIITSIAQVTLGMASSIKLVSIPIAMAFFTLIIVLFALYWLKVNINRWVSYLEGDDYCAITSIVPSRKRKLICDREDSEAVGEEGHGKIRDVE